jgi:protoporphyrin/coproporphyrin ferrochelatase
MEVVYDLDTQARAKAEELGLPIERVATVGTDPRFLTMIRTLIEERIATENGELPVRVCVGNRPASHDVCASDCCPAPVREAVASDGRPRPGRPTSDGVPSGRGPVV